MMMAQWQLLLDRIDALSLRERVFLCLSVLVCVLAVADFVWFTPAQTEHRQLVQRFASQTTELDRLRNELRLAGVPSDLGRAARDELQNANQRLLELNAEIAALDPSDNKGPPLAQVLQQLLRRQQGLTLVSLDTLKPQAGAAERADHAPDLPVGVSRQGLLLKVAGPYAELVRYVQALETALPGLRWGAMELRADQRSSELSLLVYALGVQP
jgi:MSHA biogenesis protein MshJ